MIARLALAAAALFAPVVAQAQALRCAVPASIPRPRPDLPSASQPARRLPIGSYTLALTWAPQYCFNRQRDPASRFECGGSGAGARGGNRFGFTLHGLWPDGVGPEWPQYCAATPLVPREVIRDHLCTTPSAQLIQHEWAKHGTCMAGETPASYFARSARLYRALRFPGMDALSRRPTLTVGAFTRAFAAVNPGLPAEAIRVTVTSKGWLDELWLCLDRRFAYERCRANSGGRPDATRLKVWRTR